MLSEIMKNKNLHRSIPFWSWNDKLESEMVKNQIESMNDAKIGGFFMHARGGLITEYMGEKWFEITKDCIEKAKELKMEAWAYDENGWPSGFASGKVPKLGVDYQQKWLEIKNSGEVLEGDWILGYYKIENNKLIYSKTNTDFQYAIIVCVNKYYIDAINKKTIEKFIECTHEEYYKRFKDDFGNGLEGFFTDEPQYGRTFTPWSQVIEAEFTSRFGYSATENLALLFMEAEGHEKFRNDYHSLVNELFTTGFMKQMYDWCSEHNCKLTGHMMCEDNLIAQMNCTGGVMPSYEYFHIPGIDWLCRKIDNPIVPKQVGSAAAQLGKDRVLTESFALCGWDVSLDELKWIASWQYVNGVNLICQHLEGYTLRGFRKRDYPPSLFIQQTWFDEYHHFNEYFNKLGSALSSGTDMTKTLMLHPIRSAYVVTGSSDAFTALNDHFINDTEKLSALHIEHHYGDETLMSKYAHIDGQNIIVGKCSYDKIVMPHLINISSSTLKLLSEFLVNGGRLYHFGKTPCLVEGVHSQDLADMCKKSIELESDSEILSNIETSLSITVDNKECEHIHVMSKALTDGILYFIVNLDKENGYKAKVKFPDGLNASYIDLLTDEVSACEDEISFENMQTHLIYASKTTTEISTPKQKPTQIKLDKMFDIESQSDNSITLDTCEYSINDGEWQAKKAVILVQNELLALKAPCDIKMKFTFNVDTDISRLKLALECPLEFDITINGEAVTPTVDGFYVDSSFETIDIIKYSISGRNEIILSRRFFQSDHVYHVLFGKGIHETEKNKLTYDVELESIYLIGDFSVKHTGDVTYGERKAIFATENFSLAKKVNKIDISSITESGYWFFRGSMRLTQKIYIEELKSHELNLSKLNAPIAKIFVNGVEAKLLMFAPFTADITSFLTKGENLIAIELFSSNRNLLGPHHRSEGESYTVGPHSFTDVLGWSDTSSTWNDGYCFVKFGVEL